ncbi:MAG: tripartite tricarboxylate transporter TctB family protein [Candidatus Ventricola sp.]
MRENKKRNYTDLISGIVIMVLAAFFFYTTFGTKSFLGTGRGRTAPDTIPKAVAIAMFVLGAIIAGKWVFQAVRGTLPPCPVTDDAADCEGMTKQQIHNRHLFQRVTMPLTLLFIFGYIFAMPRVGFTISTFFFLTLQITLLSADLSAKSWCRSLLIALIAAVGIYIIFGCAFNLAVPKVSFVDLGLGRLYRLIFN